MLGDFQCWISFLCQYNIVQSVSRAKKGGSPQRRSLSKPVFVIVDKHPTHLAKSVAGFLASAVRKLTLFFLPLQSAIPNELVWNDLKAQCVGRKSSRRCHNCGEWSSHTCGSYRSPLRWCEAFSTHLPRVTRHAKSGNYHWDVSSFAWGSWPADHHPAAVPAEIRSPPGCPG
jgi:hypothetical protein